MNKRIIKQLIIPYVLISALIFYLMIMFLDPNTLIILLNSLFVGTMISISVAYGSILIPAIFGIRPYDDVRVLAIGIFGGWFAYGLVVISSIYVNAADLPRSVLAITSIGRWIAINSAVIQIVAPDFNQEKSFFYGRDRKLLILGLFLGVAFTALVFYLQAEEALKDHALFRWVFV
jgi:hypothetical protein